MDASEWNGRWPVGTKVRVTKANGEVLHTRTVSRAERWGGLDHVAVAGIQPGFVLLSWCEPDAPPSVPAPPAVRASPQG